MIHDEGRKADIHGWNMRGNRRKIKRVMKVFSVYLMQVDSQSRLRQSEVPDIARVVTPATIYRRL